MTETTTTTAAASSSPMPSTGERILRAAANLFSFIFSPLLGPTYAMGVAWSMTIMYLLPAGTMRLVMMVVFGLTCLFPMVSIGVLLKLKVVSDPGLNKRRERTIPFIISAIGYAACFFFFRMITAPEWLTMFVLGGLAALVIAAVVNMWWKISVHLTAMGGIVAFIVRLIVDGVALFHPLGWLIAAIIAAGLVGTSRLLLRRHTPWQVAAGFANGFLCVLAFTAL